METGHGCCALIQASIPSRSSSAGAIRARLGRRRAFAPMRASTRSISMSAVHPIACATAAVTSVRMAAEAMIAYLERETAAGIRASCILRHVVGLFHQVPGARAFRRHLSIASVKPGAGAEVLRDALSLIAGGAAPAETAAA